MPLLQPYRALNDVLAARQPVMTAKPLLVLDLDETLVSSIPTPSPQLLEELRLPHSLIEVEFSGRVVVFAVFKRPFLECFLRYVARFYRLAIWSAGSAEYVHGVHNAVLCAIAEFEFIWTNEQCEHASKYGIIGPRTAQYVKNLSTIAEPGPERLLLVDNNRYNAVLQPKNHIHMPDFTVLMPGAWRDNCLPELAEFLERLAALSDVRAASKVWWPTAELASESVQPRKYQLYLSLTALRDWRLRRHHRRRGMVFKLE